MRIRPYLAALVLPALCITLTLGASAAHAAPVATNCFSPTSWSADPADIPCATVTAPDNDLVRIIQGTTTMEEAECIVNTANIGDARCHRIAYNRATDSPMPYTSFIPFHRRAVAAGPFGIAVVNEVQEDGSVRVGIWAAKVPIHCYLGNPVEEPRTFTVPCS